MTPHIMTCHAIISQGWWGKRKLLWQTYIVNSFCKGFTLKTQCPSNDPLALYMLASEVLLMLIFVYINAREKISIHQLNLGFFFSFSMSREVVGYIQVHFDEPSLNKIWIMEFFHKESYKKLPRESRSLNFTLASLERNKCFRQFSLYNHKKLADLVLFQRCYCIPDIKFLPLILLRLAFLLSLSLLFNI